MNVGFLTGASVSVRDGKVWTNAGLGRLLDAVASRCARLTVAAPVVMAAPGSHDHETTLRTASLVPLPEMPSIARAMRHGPAVRRALERVQAQSDVVIVQLPFAPPTGLLPVHGPRVYHACADVIGVVASSSFYRGPRKLAARATAQLLETWQRLLIARPDAALVANGEALREKLGAGPHSSTVVSSALRAEEIGSVGRTRAADAPMRILFVGFLRPEKGLDVLVRAFRIVLRTRPDAELVIVGARDLAEGGAEALLRTELDDLERAGSVRRVGHVPFGPGLFAHYADADVLALPSRSEGTPRVLVEARAFGCPVVASRVGGVPTSVHDDVDGLLVPPGDATALADAMLRAGAPGPVRERLVREGLALARRTTVDVQAEALLDAASGLLSRRSVA